MVIQKPCQTYLDYWPVNFERLATFKSEIALGYLFGYLAPEPFWARAAAELVTGHVHLLYILTSFWVLRAPKSWSKHFLQPFFNLFCSFYGFFSDFTAEINKKVWKWTKKLGTTYNLKYYGNTLTRGNYTTLGWQSFLHGNLVKGHDPGASFLHFCCFTLAYSRGLCPLR